MNYIHEFKDQHLIAMGIVGETLTNRYGISLRDFHYRIATQLKFERWIKTVLFKDVWDFPVYLESEDLPIYRIEKGSKELKELKNRLGQKSRTSEDAVKQSYFPLLRQVDGHRFAVRLFYQNQNTPTLWVDQGKTSIGKEDYYVSFGDLLHFFSNMIYSDPLNKLYKAILDMFFTISFDYARNHRQNSLTISSTPYEELAQVGKEIYRYLLSVYQEIR